MTTRRRPAPPRRLAYHALLDEADQLERLSARLELAGDPRGSSEAAQAAAIARRGAVLIYPEALPEGEAYPLNPEPEV